MLEARRSIPDTVCVLGMYSITICVVRAMDTQSPVNSRRAKRSSCLENIPQIVRTNTVEKVVIGCSVHLLKDCVGDSPLNRQPMELNENGPDVVIHPGSCECSRAEAFCASWRRWMLTLEAPASRPLFVVQSWCD